MAAGAEVAPCESAPRYMKVLSRIRAAVRRVMAARALPPRELAQRVVRAAVRATLDVPRRSLDRVRATYGPRPSGAVPLRSWLAGWTDRFHISEGSRARYAALSEH